jgi:glycosyltransferase involved in cell wall biosynthesis/O-antigen ligase
MFELLMALLVTRSALEIFTDVRLGPLNLNVPALTAILLLAMAAWLLLRRGKAAWHPLLTGWAAWLLALLPFVFLSWKGFGREGLIAAREWVRLLSIPAVFLLAYNLRPRIGKKSGLQLLFWALPLPLLLAVYQMITRTGWVMGTEFRLMGTLSHPNSLGIFLVFFLGLTYERARRGPQPLWTVLIAIEMVFLVGALNVGGYFMLGALLIWIFIREDGRGRVFAVGLSCLFALILLTNRQAPAKMKTVKSFAPAKIEQAVVQQQYHSSLGWRFANWGNLIEFWKQKKWLGYGLHTTSFVNPWKTEKNIGSAPHNDFVRYLLETGIVGLSAFCAFLLFSFIVIMKAAVKARPARGAPMLWILAGMFLAWQGGSLGDNLISTTVFQFYLWGGLGFALREQQDEEASQKAEASGMRIWTTVYPIDDRGVKTGGIETFIRQFVRSTPLDGELRIVGVTARKGGLKKGVWHSIPFEGKTVRFLPVLRVGDPNRRGRIPLFLRFTAAAAARTHLFEGRGQVWLFHRIEPAMALGRVPGEKILFLHCDPRHLQSSHNESRWRGMRALYTRLERRLIPRFERVYVVSRPALEAMRAIHPRRADRFSFLPTSYDETVFRPRREGDREAARKRLGLPAEGSLALWVGRLESAKDPFLLLDVFKRLQGLRRGVQLAVAGGGSLEEGLKARSRELGLGDRIHWLGRKTPLEVADLMTAADVLLMTSAFEAMPIVALEALGCGLPVIAPDLGELKSLITDEARGRLTATRDPEALAAATAEILSRTPFVRTGFAGINEFAAAAVFERLGRDLNHIVPRAGGAAS